MGKWSKSKDQEDSYQPTGAELAPDPKESWDFDQHGFFEEWHEEFEIPEDPRDRRQLFFAKAFVHCLYNCDKACKIVNVSVSTAYRWLREKKVRAWINHFAIELESKLMERCLQEAIYGHDGRAERMFLLKALNPMMCDKYRLHMLRMQGEQEKEALDRPPRPVLRPPTIPDRIQKRFEGLDANDKVENV